MSNKHDYEDGLRGRSMDKHAQYFGGSDSYYDDDEYDEYEDYDDYDGYEDYDDEYEDDDYDEDE